MNNEPRRWSWKRWTLIGLVTAVVLAVGGPFFYIHVIEGPPPKKLSLANVTPLDSITPSVGNSGSTGEVVGIDGTWTVSSGSQVGYRVKEVLFGQSTTAVGRTSDVSGQMSISGTIVTAASFTTQMSTVKSDQSRRDGQFQGRIMDVEDFPTSTFVMSQPLDLGTIPDAGKVVTNKVVGALTLRGVTKDVTVDLSAKRVGASIAVSSEVPITFGDYSIPNPTFGPASVGNNGTLEVLLVFNKAS